MGNPSDPLPVPILYFPTTDPDVLEAYAWNPDDQAYNLYRGRVRREDVAAAQIAAIDQHSRRTT